MVCFKAHHGRTKIEAFLEIAVEHAVDQAGNEGIARSQPIDDFHFVSLCPK